MRRELVMVDGIPRIRLVLTPRPANLQPEVDRLKRRVGELEQAMEMPADPAPTEVRDSPP